MSAIGPKRALKENSKADWQTPPELFAWLDGIFDFMLDAAASEENNLSAYYIDEEMDALGCREWAEANNTYVWNYKCGAFCNPPYGNLMPWVERFSLECSRGWLVVALLPANTDTRWFAHCWETAAEIWFLTPRVSFITDGKPVKGNTGGSMIVVWRPDRLPGGYPPVTRLINWKEVCS